MSSAARKMLLRTSWKFVLTALFVTGTHSQLFGGVECGDKLRGTLNDGRRFSGQFHARTADSIVIKNGSNYQWFPTNEIRSVQKGKKRTLEGFLYGGAICGAIGAYYYEEERKAAEERYKRELDDFYSRPIIIPTSKGRIHDTKSLGRDYSRFIPPKPPKGPNPLLVLGPMIGGAVLGAIIGNSIYTYKSISLKWSVIPPGYCTLPDRTEYNNYSIRFQLRL